MYRSRGSNVIVQTHTLTIDVVGKHDKASLTNGKKYS